MQRGKAHMHAAERRSSAIAQMGLVKNMNHAEAQQSQPTTDISTVECRSEQSSFRSYAAGKSAYAH